MRGRKASFKTLNGEELKGTIIDFFWRGGCEKVYKVKVKSELHYVDFWQIKEII